MKKLELISYKGDSNYYIPSEGDFKTIGGNNSGEGGAKADRVNLATFVPGQSYCGVIKRKILDKQGKFGISDLYFFSRLVGGSTAHGNLKFKEVDDMIAVNSAMLKDRVRPIPDGSLIIITYVNQHETKRYKIYNVHIDSNYKPQGSSFNSNQANSMQQASQNANREFQPQNNQHNQSFNQSVSNNNFKQQQQQQYTPVNTSDSDDDLPF